MCDKDCKSTSCPFAFTDESETVQNYGCLPTPYQIISMRVNHGKTWACHSNFQKPCAGALMHLKEYGYDASIIDKNLVNLDNLTEELMTMTESDIVNIESQRVNPYAELI